VSVRESLAAIGVVGRYRSGTNGNAHRRAPQSHGAALWAIVDRLSGARAIAPGALLAFGGRAVFVERLETTMANQTTRASPQVSVRLDAELAATIEQAAARERRSVSNLVRNVLADWAAATRHGGGHEQRAA
jgi:hypothetical protein